MAEPRRRSGFGPVVLAGLGSAAVVAVTSARDWFVLGTRTKVGFLVPDDQLRADMPIALALALVLLAAWGVVLVTGARTRRIVLTLAALAAVGVVVCLVVAPFTLPDDIRSGLPGGGAGSTADPTAAYVIACVAGPLALAAVAVGWLLAPAWPTMSARYDAPAAASPEDDTDLWKALDRGHDPTDRPAPPSA